MLNYTEFRAVILAAGSGSQMPELVNERMPKCLLPIAGQPMIFYPIRMLAKYFRVIEIVVKSSEKSRIERAVRALETAESADRVRLVLCEIDDDDCELGTLFALKRLSVDRFGDYSDFDSLVIVSCDLISNFDVGRALNTARKKQADFFSVWCESKIESFLKAAKLPSFIKSKSVQDRDLIAIDARTNRLLYMNNLQDLDAAGNLELPPECLSSSRSRITVYSDRSDLHFYVLKKWVFLHIRSTCENRIRSDESSSWPGDGVSLKHEFLANFVKMQFIRVPASANGHQHSQSFRSIVHFVRDTTAEDNCRVYAFRVNNLAVYWFVNLHGEQFGLGARNGQRRGYETVRERKSTLGRDCSFASGTRISTSILMDNVRISGENCVLENCLVCENVQIRATSVLKNCLIGYDYCVDASSGSGNEVVLSDEILMLDTDDIFDGN